jgi:hypothetical protein
MFFNTGILMNRSQLPSLTQVISPPSSSNLQSFISEYACMSIGTGLQIRISQAARLEINYTYPVLVPPAAATSVPQGGSLQIGLGVDFL